MTVITIVDADDIIRKLSECVSTSAACKNYVLFFIKRKILAKVSSHIRMMMIL